MVGWIMFSVMIVGLILWFGNWKSPEFPFSIFMRALLGNGSGDLGGSRIGGKPSDQSQRIEVVG